MFNIFYFNMFFSTNRTNNQINKIKIQYFNATKRERVMLSEHHFLIKQFLIHFKYLYNLAI